MKQSVRRVGVAFSEVTDQLMMLNKPINGQSGVFIAGEMLDWEAPTGGYLRLPLACPRV